MEALSSAGSALGSLARRAGGRQTPLEKNLEEATSNANWGCPNSVLHEIARATFNYDEFPQVRDAIWAGIQEKPKNWRRIIKTLTLLEFVIKNGSDRMLEEMRSGQYKVRPLMDFTFTEEGRDKGSGIRDKAKMIIELISDQDLLRAERDKARDHRNKFAAGFSSAGDYGNSNSNRDNGGSGGGGGGRYDPHIEEKFEEMRRKKEEEKSKSKFDTRRPQDDDRHRDDYDDRRRRDDRDDRGYGREDRDDRRKDDRRKDDRDDRRRDEDRRPRRDDRDDRDERRRRDDRDDRSSRRYDDEDRYRREDGQRKAKPDAQETNLLDFDAPSQLAAQPQAVAADWGAFNSAAASPAAPSAACDFGDFTSAPVAPLAQGQFQGQAFPGGLPCNPMQFPQQVPQQQQHQPENFSGSFQEVARSPIEDVTTRLCDLNLKEKEPSTKPATTAMQPSMGIPMGDMAKGMAMQQSIPATANQQQAMMQGMHVPNMSTQMGMQGPVPPMAMSGMSGAMGCPMMGMQGSMPGPMMQMGGMGMMQVMPGQMMQGQMGGMPGQMVMPGQMMPGQMGMGMQGMGMPGMGCAGMPGGMQQGMPAGQGGMQGTGMR